MSLPDVTEPSAGPASVELAIDSELQPGTKVGEYQIESKLGQGGMATVYAGVQPVIGKKVALKVMSRHLCVDPVQVERFVQEARAVNQIGHPNIVDVFAFGALPDGRSYLVMEWLQGETLAARLRDGPLSVPEAVAIMFQICDGLAAAHDKGIVHRDLKPENIFLVPVRNRRMLVKLLDFGIAKLLGRRDARIDRTADGSTPGTPGYMSPEQARGKDVDHRSDIYTLGVCAFEMVCGKLPFRGADIVETLYQHIHAVPPAPSTLRADLPLQLERLILQMLEKRADRRPTIPVIEERLADLRDGVLAAMGDTGPFPLRALEMDSGPHKALAGATAEGRAQPTDDVQLPRSGPSRGALALAALAVAAAAGAAVVVKTWRTTPAATAPAATAPAATAPEATAATATQAAPTPAAPTPAAPTPAAPPIVAAPSLTTPPLKLAATPIVAAPVMVAPPAQAHGPPSEAHAPPRKSTPHHRFSREKPEAAAPAPSSAPHNRDYMIDPFAPKK